MLEHLPHWLGAAMSNVRAGSDKLTTATVDLYGAVPIQLSSLAFADGARLPERFTADGEGVSPPLQWGPLPQGTASLLLIVEDPDAFTPRPIVHAIVAGIDIDTSALPEGAIRPDGDGGPIGDSGTNSFGREGWLPPDPPTGHGRHRYAFQLFALDADVGDPGDTPGRTAVLEAMAGHVFAAGVLIGTYSRGEEAPVGPAGAVAAA